MKLLDTPHKANPKWRNCCFTCQMPFVGSNNWYLQNAWKSATSN